MPPAAPPPPSPEGVARWAHERGVGRADLLAGLLVAALHAHGHDQPDTPLLRAAAAPAGPPAGLPVRGEQVTPDLLGEVLGASAPAEVRRAAGAVFTPRATAEGLVRVALAACAEPPGVGPGVVFDPSVGGGAFTLASVRALEAAGLSPAAAAGAVAGADTDPLAVAVTRAALGLWSLEQAGAWVDAPGVVEADFLLHPGTGLDGPVRLVVGNPPFQSQLRGPGVRSPERLAVLRERFGTAVGPYTDTAALFLLAALEVVAAHGVVALVQPRSFLGAGGAGEVRRRLLEQAAVVGLWEPTDRVFAAAVDVCALVVVADVPQPAEIVVWSDRHLEDPGQERDAAELLPEQAGRDGAVVARTRGDQPPPLPSVVGAGRLGDRSRATAGFRDQFYGMAPWVREAAGPDDPRPRLVTSGLVDPGACSWGRRPARFAGQRWDAPVLELSGLDPDGRVGRWVRARLVPKIVVASQTKVIEAVLDREGQLIPSPPCISVEAPAAELDRLLAALLSPPATVWLHGRAGGTGLAPGALRVSVRDLLELPLPTDEGAWDEAVGLLPDRLGDDPASRAFGLAMAAAYGLALGAGDAAEAVVTWWAARLPALPHPPG